MSCVREISDVYNPLSFKLPPLRYGAAINKLFQNLIVASKQTRTKAVHVL